MKASPRTHEGRVALVTGAGQGIGQAIALALAERGAEVIATDLTPPDDTVRKSGPAARALPLDVTREEDWRSALAASLDLGGVDIVVNNAGYFPNRSIDELDHRKCGVARTYQHRGDCTSIGRAKARHLGTAGH